LNEPPLQHLGLGVHADAGDLGQRIHREQGRSHRNAPQRFRGGLDVGERHQVGRGEDLSQGSHH
jgi:hypothetical protein